MPQPNFDAQIIFLGLPVNHETRSAYRAMMVERDRVDNASTLEKDIAAWRLANARNRLQSLGAEKPAYLGDKRKAA